MLLFLLIFKLTHPMQFVTKKVIKGSPYYYMQYGSYISYIGPIIPNNIKALLLDFFINIGKEEVKKLDKNIIKEFAPKNLTNIEVMRHIFILISRSELFSYEYQRYLTELTIHFTYNSNRSEGSKVTKNEVEKISLSTVRKPKSRSEREIFNSFAALKFTFSDNFNWNALNVRRVHHLLLNDLDDPLIVGRWKNENNVAPGNQPTSSPENVNSEMMNLLEWFNKQKRKKMYPPLLAIEFYIKFESIHPFIDGNGRTGRILFDAILFHSDYMPIVFFTENHASHCKAIAKAIEGKYGNFRKHFLEQAEKTIKLIKLS